MGDPFLCWRGSGTVSYTHLANNIEKKIKSELVKLMKDDREKYQQFWTAFGMQFKYALMNALSLIHIC